MKNVHLIYTPFTGVGLHGGFRGNKWLEHRIEVFKNYTLKSMLNQSHTEFLHWFSFRPEESTNPRVLGLAKHLESINYPFIFTFNGLMYWDDKFNKFSIKVAMRNMLMMLWDCWKNKELKNPIEILKYTFERKNKTLLKRVTYSLEAIKRKIGINYDWVYLTRIDSDDMFHKETVELIQSQEPAYKRALVFQNGYILNVTTGQVAEWKPPTNPPFHTIIFPASVFFSPASYLSYYEDFTTHEDITRIFDCVVLDMNRYLVSFHKKHHIGTTWETPLIKRVYHRMKFGAPVKGYAYTTSGKNISTHWTSHSQIKNFMIGKEFESPLKEEILSDFGI